MLLQLIVGLAALGAHDTQNDAVLRKCLAVSLLLTLGALVLIFAAWVYRSRKLDACDPGPWPGRNFGDCSPPTARELKDWRAETTTQQDGPFTLHPPADAAGRSLAQTRMQSINDELLHMSGPDSAQDYVDALDCGAICGMFRDALACNSPGQKALLKHTKRNFYDLMAQVWSCEENLKGDKRHLCGVYSQWTWGEVRERTANL